MTLARRTSAAALTLALACASAEIERAAPRPLRVAACQIEARGDLAAGLEAIDAALREARAGGAELAVFPEACLLGWVNPEAHRLAAPIPGATTERLGELARAHGLMLAVGLAERDGEDLYNSVVLIDRDGRLLLRHRKANVLEGLMQPPYSRGDGAAAVVDTRLGRVGLLICADTFEDGLVDALAAQRPELVLVPYGWAAPPGDWPGHGESLHDWIAHTARRVQAPVVGVDASGVLAHGPWTGYVLGGQSLACDRDGTRLHALADRAPEVGFYDLTLRASGAPTHEGG